MVGVRWFKINILTLNKFNVGVFKLKISFIDLADWPLPNIGLAYIIASLQNSPHKSFLIDCFPNRKKDYILKEIRQQEPDVVGISVLTCNLKYAVEIAKLLKKENQKIKIIFGGIHPTLEPKETLKIQEVDAVCIGEGELTIIEYLDKLGKNEELTVKGIWYRRDGKIIKNPLRPLIDNLDSLSFPAWDFWDMGLYFKTFPKPSGGLYVLTSRGCPYSCHYCSQKALRNILSIRSQSYYRVRSAKNVIDEIKWDIKKYRELGLKAFLFADDTFGLDRKQFRQLTEFYIKENVHNEYCWGCQTRADIIDKEWVYRAKKSSCFLVEMGMENVDEKVRIEKYNKNITNTQFKKAIGLLNKNGIIYNLNILIGSYGETISDMNNNVQKAWLLTPLFLYISPYIPHPKIELRFQHGESVIKDTKLLGGLPRIETAFLSISELNKFIWWTRVRQVIRKVKIGFKLKKIIFFLDLLKYIFNYKGIRQIGFLHPLAQIHMFDRKILDYYLESKI